MQTSRDDEIFNNIQRWMANHHGEISEIIRNPNVAIGSRDAALTKELIMIYETNGLKNRFTEVILEFCIIKVLIMNLEVPKKP